MPVHSPLLLFLQVLHPLINLLSFIRVRWGGKSFKEFFVWWKRWCLPYISKTRINHVKRRIKYKIDAIIFDNDAIPLENDAIMDDSDAIN
jgi:hypothetical protein